MKKKIFTITIVLTVFLNCMTVYGAKDKIDYQQKEFQLKEEYINLKNQYVDLKKELNNEQVEVYKKVNSINNDWKMLKTILIILGFTGIPSIIAYTIEFKKTIKSTINRKVQDIVMGKTELIVELMKKQSEENNIIDSKKILVISKNCESKINIDNILLKRFKKKSNILIDEFNNQELYDPLEDYDLILFNRFTYEERKSTKQVNDKDKEFIQNIIKKNKNNKTVYFWFDTPRLDLGKENLGEYNLNFSNSDIMLYSNVLESLKFQSKFLISR